MIQKANYVFPYLSIDVDTDSSFATMDTFRLFDRSGRGNIQLEDFVIGIIEKLNSLRKDVKLLEQIAEQLLQVESRCTELATLLEKGHQNSNYSAKFLKYDANLKALSHLIRSQIRALKLQDNISAIQQDILIRIFQHALQQVMIDIQGYFHLSLNRISHIEDSQLLLTPTNEIQPLKMMWNIFCRVFPLF